MKRALPVVQKLIAAPCDVPWSSMKGDDRKRHCSECDRDVHNLSAMTKDEVQAFLQAIVHAPANALLPCVSIYARQDGTVLTEDCPVGLRARRKKALMTSMLGLGGVAVAALTALVFLHHHTPAQAVHAEPVVVETPQALPASPVFAPPVAPLGLDTTAPGLVTIDGPPGTVVFEGATRLGFVPLAVSATPGDHTYRASLRGQDEVFALHVTPNSGSSFHRVSLAGTTTTSTKPVGTGTAKPGWGGHPRLAGKIAPPRDWGTRQKP